MHGTALPIRSAGPGPKPQESPGGRQSRDGVDNAVHCGFPAIYVVGGVYQTMQKPIRFGCDSLLVEETAHLPAAARVLQLA
jgi:hypothetical protein